LKGKSQHGEDAVLFDLIGDQVGGIVFDVGARLKGSNVAKLIEERDFTGVLVEANKASAEILKKEFGDKVIVFNVQATFDNINQLAPPEIDVCSIDVDSIDWWLWARLEVNPRFVVIESNTKMKTGYAPYDPDVNWHSKPYGASGDALKKLGEIKGYELVTQKGVNLIFRRI